MSLKEKLKTEINKQGGLIHQTGNTIIPPELTDNIPNSLNEIEEQINNLQGHYWKVSYHIGKRLIEIKEKYLAETGFENIYTYALDKFGIGQRTCYNYIYLATNFNALQVTAMGYKLVLLQSLEKNDFQKYLKWIEKENPSLREIENKIKSDYPKQGRPLEPINLSKSKLTIDFRIMQKKINNDKRNDFLEELTKLIEKYSI